MENSKDKAKSKSKVFVLHLDGRPLMPCCPARARILLSRGEAKVVRKLPFTIQLTRESGDIVQDVSLGIDPGETVGISATTEDEVLFEAQVKHRDVEVKESLSTRREARRTRRGRKTRYRKTRFQNRKKKDGWLAPSVRTLLETYRSIFLLVKKILPISNIVVEYSQFDVQKLKNPDISGTEYQNGEQSGFWDVREYVLYRDKHTCQHCKGRSGDKILNVHHIESRKTGGNRPDNLVTLCKTCHQDFHNGKIRLADFHLSKGFQFPTKMNIIKDRLVELLKDVFIGTKVRRTFGSITKSERIANGLEKEHHVDARVISGNPKASTAHGCGLFLFQKVRRHNRKIFKDKTLRGGKRKRNQCPYTVRGFHRFDIVQLDGRLLFVNGLRASGQFLYKDLSDKTVRIEKSCKKTRLIQHRGGFVVGLKK